MMGRLGRWPTVVVMLVVMLGFPPLALAQEFPCPPDMNEIAEMRATADEIREFAREPNMGESVRAGFIVQAAEWDAMANEWIAFCASQPAADAGTQPTSGSSPQPASGSSAGSQSAGFPSTGSQPSTMAQGGSFQGQDFPFTMQWGPEWTLVQQGGAGTGAEGVQLGNGVSSVFVTGVTTTETPQNTVERVAASLESPMQFASVVFDEPDRAAAYYVSADQQLGAFIDGIVLDGQSTLVVMWTFPAAQHEAEFDRFAGLMDGLRFTRGS